MVIRFGRDHKDILQHFRETKQQRSSNTLENAMSNLKSSIGFVESALEYLERSSVDTAHVQTVDSVTDLKVDLAQVRSRMMALLKFYEYEKE